MSYSPSTFHMDLNPNSCRLHQHYQCGKPGTHDLSSMERPSNKFTRYLKHSKYVYSSKQIYPTDLNYFQIPKELYTASLNTIAEQYTGIPINALYRIRERDVLIEKLKHENLILKDPAFESGKVQRWMPETNQAIIDHIKVNQFVTKKEGPESLFQKPKELRINDSHSLIKNFVADNLSLKKVEMTSNNEIDKNKNVETGLNLTDNFTKKDCVIKRNQFLLNQAERELSQATLKIRMISRENRLLKDQIAILKNQAEHDCNENFVQNNSKPCGDSTENLTSRAHSLDLKEIKLVHNEKTAGGPKKKESKPLKNLMEKIVTQSVLNSDEFKKMNKEILRLSILISEEKAIAIKLRNDLHKLEEYAKKIEKQRKKKPEGQFNNCQLRAKLTKNNEKEQKKIFHKTCPNFRKFSKTLLQLKSYYLHLYVLYQTTQTSDSLIGGQGTERCKNKEIIDLINQTCEKLKDEISLSASHLHKSRCLLHKKTYHKSLRSTLNYLQWIKTKCSDFESSKLVKSSRVKILCEICSTFQVELLNSDILEAASLYAKKMKNKDLTWLLESNLSHFFQRFAATLKEQFLLAENNNLLDFKEKENFYQRTVDNFVVLQKIFILKFLSFGHQFFGKNEELDILYSNSRQHKTEMERMVPKKNEKQDDKNLNLFEESTVKQSNDNSSCTNNFESWGHLYNLSEKDKMNLKEILLSSDCLSKTDISINQEPINRLSGQTTGFRESISPPEFEVNHICNLQPFFNVESIETVQKVNCSNNISDNCHKNNNKNSLKHSFNNDYLFENVGVLNETVKSERSLKIDVMDELKKQSQVLNDNESKVLFFKSKKNDDVVRSQSTVQASNSQQSRTEPNTIKSILTDSASKLILIQTIDFGIAENVKNSIESNEEKSDN